MQICKLCLFHSQNTPRELCDESMTQSVSSASSLDSHAPSEYSGQSQGAKWEEQQKVLALEQLCGVFRVDLGHMRSLRLFFRLAGSHGRGHGALCCESKNSARQVF